MAPAPNPRPSVPVAVERAARVHGGARMRWAEQLARLLDDGFSVPGTELRFGLDPIIGLVAPGIGDILVGLVNLALVIAAVREGVPIRIVLRMVVNVLIDVFLGAVPVAGDAFDFVWKATRKNLNLIDAHRSGKPPSAADYLVLALIVAAILAALVLPVLVFVALIVWLLHR